MAVMLNQFNVKDFGLWKKVFDAHADLRKSNGELSHQIFQDASDPNRVTVLNKWNSLEIARKFSQSPELKAAMAEAGVIGPPTFSLLNEA